MKIVYFISSGTCSNEDQYGRCLLHHDNMEEKGDIYSSNDSQESNYEQKIKSTFPTIRKKVISGGLNSDREIKRFYTNENCPGDDKLREFLRLHKDWLIDNEVIQTEVEQKLFKKVYKLRNPASEKLDWVLYGVCELNSKDNADIREKIRSQWCDKLITFILETHKEDEDLKEIHLFLHDKDIEGYSDLSLQIIDGRDACRKKNLINDATLKEMEKRKAELDITFFQHTNPYIKDIIDRKDEDLAKRIKYLKEKFDVALNYLRGIDEAKKLANKIKKDMDYWNNI